MLQRFKLFVPKTKVAALRAIEKNSNMRVPACLMPVPFHIFNLGHFGVAASRSPAVFGISGIG